MRSEYPSPVCSPGPEADTLPRRRYCNLAIRLDDLSHLADFTWRERMASWWRYTSWRWTLWVYTLGAEGKTVLERVRGIRRKELVLEL